MTTASVLLTVSTTWGTNSDLCDKEDRVSRSVRNIAAVAARELRETPGTRDQALKIMRDWIEQNSDIKNVRTGMESMTDFHCWTKAAGNDFQPTRSCTCIQRLPAT